MSRFSNRLKTPTGIVSTVAAVLVGLTFCKLGLWQLSRADEKNAIVAEHRAASELPPLESLSVGAGGKIDISVALYRRVALTGKFDSSRQFLLDNRTVAGQPGFEVITPFILPDDQYILVNLGWIGHNGDRQVSFASDGALEKEMTLQGTVVTPSKGFVLGDYSNESGNTDWPVILQFIDYETIAAKLDKIPALDAVVVAARGHVGGYTYNWKPVASGAQKHLGYAFQWFAMLFALIVLYFYLMVLKQENE